ncbi:flagellar hook-length control protein FliK [Devosia sp. SL43]|uniref:flagellar hook-length control protein FliK n=1 Tax=Devosia sp. SL43 TaxID=2806348 RepID=UPI001F2818F4|nr:flagellar hook-length control protein FliK [Devosia sp. SL43]UJW87213.1 flagellar hook-length control protein FliK [Devosia sp. SL43]
MASHLTITPSAGVNVTKGGLNAQAGVGADTSAEGGIMGVFAALLGAANQNATATTSAETTTDLSLGNLVNLSFGAGFGSEDGEQTEDPEAIAAAIDVALPIQTTVDAGPVLADLVDSLTELKQSLEAGEAVNPELLKRIDAALDDLAAQFDIDLSALPSLDDLTAMVTGVLPDDTSVEAQLTIALAPLAEELLSGSSDTDVSVDVELSTLIKSIGEKLGALLQSINSDEISPEKLAALGLDAEGSIDTDLEAAIARLLNPPVKVDASANAQVIATPQLKLTEPVLTGKATTETAPIADKAEATADVAPQVATSVDGRATTDTDSGASNTPDDDRKPVEAKTAPATAVAAPVETATTDPQVAAQPTHVASRIDAAAARPVVQAGYQTSQQQLNLPQLAFELVRQVNDGNTRFQMRLDPPELGKIDVRLDIDAAGQVSAKLIVERAETLDLMQRDQRGLERALQQAGLDSAKTNLEFSLKQSPFSGGNQQGQDGNGRQPQFGGNGSAEAEDVPPPTVNLYRGSLTASGVNIIA